MRLPGLRHRRANAAAVVVLSMVALAGGGLIGHGYATRGHPPTGGVIAADPTGPTGPTDQAATGTLPPAVFESVAPTPGATPKGTTGAQRPDDDPDDVGVLPRAVAGARLKAAAGRLADVSQDQGMTVALPDGRNLWIFADTIQVGHKPSFFVTSSAAVAPRGSQRLKYLSADGAKPVEFLRRTDAERATQVNGVSYTAIWPTGATMLPDGRVLIAYAEYDVVLNPSSYTLRGAGLYTYRYPGLDRIDDGGHAGRIADFWTPADGAVGSPVYHGGYVYFTQCESLECYSARTTVAGLTSRGSYRWFTGNGWGDRSDRRAMSYGSGRPGTSPSVTYLDDAGVFATVSTSAGHTAQLGQLWVAPNPWGPWSAPKDYLLPGCPTAGCYTLNLHPSESSQTRVRISYATAGEGPYVHVTDVPVTIARTAAAATVS